MRTYNYYYEDGIVGEYKGHKVIVIDYKDFKSHMMDKDVIYAVKNVDETMKQRMVLVYLGSRIGRMSADGMITTYDRIFPFTYYQSRRKEKEIISIPDKEYAPPEVKEYGFYSQEVDKFFEDLKKEDLFGGLKMDFE
jgi:hypothetical protein